MTALFVGITILVFSTGKTKATFVLIRTSTVKEMKVIKFEASLLLHPWGDLNFEVREIFCLNIDVFASKGPT